MFFKNFISKEARRNFSKLMGVKVMENLGNYMGLPLSVGRKKMDSCKGIKDKVDNKLNGWKAPLFSLAYYEFSIITIIQTIPTSVISCFRIPIATLENIVSMMARF